MTTEAVRMRDGPPVTDLVTRATCGDKQAWDALVERYIPLVWSICRRHQLTNAGARTVSEAVWRELAGELVTLRQPAGLADRLTTITQRECDRIRRAEPDLGQLPQAAATPAEQAGRSEREPRMAERHAALREAFAHLPPHCQQLIAMLTQDPPAPDHEISAKLGIPALAISQNCHDCLQNLRRHPALATLIHTETSNTGAETSGLGVT